MPRFLWFSVNINIISVYITLKVVDGLWYNIPLEVVLLSRAGAGCPSIGRSAAVGLIDYFELDHEVIVIMERPIPCTNLFDYIESNETHLEEDEA